MALESLTETIRPNAHNAELIRKARSELAHTLSINESYSGSNNPAPYIAVHIRRGDREAASWTYHGSQVPVENYVEAIRDTWSRLYPSMPLPSREVSLEEPSHFPVPPITWIASDAPEASQKFQDGFPASGAALFSLASSTDAALRGIAPKHAYIQKEFNQEEESERIRLTRGMIVDLAMVSGLWAWEGEVLPGAIVCTIRYDLISLIYHHCLNCTLAPIYVGLLPSDSDGIERLDLETMLTIPPDMSTRQESDGWRLTRRVPSPQSGRVLKRSDEQNSCCHLNKTAIDHTSILLEVPLLTALFV